MKVSESFSQNKSRILLYLIYTMLLVFAAVKVKENGDFIGYVNAGNLVLSQGDIYSDMFNTWPPAFSILSVPLAMLNSVGFVFVRILWMIVLFSCFFFCIKTCIEFFEETTFSYKELLKEVLLEPMYLLALFLSCRAFMDNLIYMQINLVMLAACCYVMKKQDTIRPLIPSFLLGISIGAKVYNVMLLPLLLLLRKWKIALYVFAGIVFTWLLCIIVFGFQQTLDYHVYWFQHMVDVKQSVVHRNQSLVAGLMRLFSMDNYKVNGTMPLADLEFSAINAIYMGLVVLLGAVYLMVFYKKIIAPDRNFVFHSLILVITMIPLLTPVSWKANYIYALPAFFFISHAIRNGEAGNFIITLFTMAAFALCLSNEAIIGRPAMYFLETWNVLVVGELLLFFSVLLQMRRDMRFNSDPGI